MLGWLVLPVANYPQSAFIARDLTMEVIGTALPSRLLITKALVVAMTVFVCLVVKAPQLFARLRVTAPDVALALFCISPLLASLAGKVSVQDGLVQAAYLAGVWGCSWMTARLALSDGEGRRGLAMAIMISGLFLLIPAVLEGARPAWIYNSVYGPHPFVFDGAFRYIGYRPLAFFEHGNQYGMWVSMAALVALHEVVVRRYRSAAHVAVAAVLAAAAIASQSIGAILLLVGGAWSAFVSLRMRRAIMVAAALLVSTAGAAYVSGKLPLRSWMIETPSGQVVGAVLRMTGRGSLSWRAQRDQQALRLIHEAPVAGHGVWDWWRPVGSHPWGLPLLIAGQFGVIALAFAAFALLVGPLRDVWRGSRSVLPLLVVLAVIDSWLNSWAYLPAIMAAAAVAAPIGRRPPEAAAAAAAGRAWPASKLEPAHD